MSKEAMKLALDALEHCKDVIVERGLNGSPEFAKKWGLTLPLERSEKAITALREALEDQPAQQEPVAALLAAIQAEPVTLIHKWRVLELVKDYAPQPAVQQEPVAFYVYKPTLPRGHLGTVSDGDLPWVYDQDPSSGFSARMLVAPVTSPPPARQQEPVQQCMDHGECFGGKCIYPAPQPAQQQEPVKPFAWANTDDMYADTAFRWCEIGDHKTPVYTSIPAQRKPLTNEQIAEMMMQTWGCASIAPRHAPAFARAIEAAHQIGVKK